MRGVLMGALLLTVLDAAVSSTDAAQRASGVLSIIPLIVEYIVSPMKPAVPDLRKHAPTGPGAENIANPFAAAVSNMQAVGSSSGSTQAQPAAPPAPAQPTQSMAAYLLGVPA